MTKMRSVWLLTMGIGVICSHVGCGAASADPDQDGSALEADPNLGAEPPETAEATGQGPSAADEGEDTGNRSNDRAEAPSVRPRIALTVTVPDSFDCIPETMENVFFESADISETPYAFGDTLHNPSIGEGQPYVLETGQVGLTGEYHMAVVLYCKGGGGGLGPVSGVDWVGLVQTPLTLGPNTGAVDAGTLELQLAD